MALGRSAAGCGEEKLQRAAAVQGASHPNVQTSFEFYLVRRQKAMQIMAG